VTCDRRRAEVEAYLAALVDPDAPDDVRGPAIGLGPADAFVVPALISALTSAPSSHRRQRIARELGFVGAASRPARPTLMAFLDDEQLQGSTALALGEIGPADDELVGGLTRLLQGSPSSFTPIYAAWALLKLGVASEPAIELAARRARDSYDLFQREWASSALAAGLPRVPAVLPRLLDCLVDEYDPIPEDMGRAFEACPPGLVIPPLLARLREGHDCVQRGALTALHYVGNALRPFARETGDALLASGVFKADWEKIRWYATNVVSIHGLDRPDLVAAMTPLLDDDALDPRVGVARALAGMRSAPAGVRARARAILGE
jgi:hypothetical protein